LDAKGSEMPKADAFAKLERIADRVAVAEGITETEVAWVSRSTASHQAGPRRHRVSALGVGEYLAVP
jgi:hypothetical protein